MNDFFKQNGINFNNENQALALSKDSLDKFMAANGILSQQQPDSTGAHANALNFLSSNGINFAGEAESETEASEAASTRD